MEVVFFVKPYDETFDSLENSIIKYSSFMDKKIEYKIT